MERSAPRTHRPSVLLAENHPLVAGGIAALLATDFDVVGSATDGRALLTLAFRLRPDVVVTDIGMPGLCGIEAASRLVRALPGLSVVFVSMHDEPEIVRRALSVGNAYVLKTTAGDELVEAVHTVLRGDGYVSQRVAR